MKPSLISLGRNCVRDSLPKRSVARGFTLIELLVVIGILAILASLLLPAVMRVKAYAGGLRCRNTLRQYTLLMSVYINDTGKYPNFGHATWARLWFNHLEPGAGTLALRDAYQEAPRCTEKIRFPTHLIDPRLPPPPNYPYWYNAIGSKGAVPLGGSVWDWGLGLVKNTDPPVYPISGDPAAGIPVSEGEVLVPSRMVAFTEMVTQDGGGGNKFWASVPHNRNEYYYPHDNGVNVAFCDGSMTSFKRKHFDNASSEFWRQWNRDNQPHSEIW